MVGIKKNKFIFSVIKMENQKLLKQIKKLVEDAQLNLLTNVCNDLLLHKSLNSSYFDNLYCIY